MKPDKAQLEELYIQREYSIQEVAWLLHLNTATVIYHLKRYGIPTREKSKRSKLMKYSPDTLRQGIHAKGVRGYSKELGIHENTLRNYMKKLKKEAL